jgi:hypothetical protein
VPHRVLYTCRMEQHVLHGVLCDSLSITCFTVMCCCDLLFAGLQVGCESGSVRLGGQCTPFGVAVVTVVVPLLAAAAAALLGLYKLMQRHRDGLNYIKVRSRRGRRGASATSRAVGMRGAAARQRRGAAARQRRGAAARQRRGAAQAGPGLRHGTPH